MDLKQLTGLFVVAALVAGSAAAETNPASTTNQAAPANWKPQFSLLASEIYSDNVDLQPSGSRNSAFVTQVTPTIRLDGKGSRLTVHADYSLQGMYYSGGSNTTALNNRLNATANAILAKDLLYLDARATIGQQYLSLAGPLSTGTSIGTGTSVNPGGIDTLAGSNNQTTVGTYSISPYIKRRIGELADVEARLSHDGVVVGSAGGGNSQTNRFNFSASSRTYFQPVTWNARYSWQNTSFQDTPDSRTESGDLNARVRLTRKFGALAQAHKEKNNFQGATGQVRDFSYWGLGAYYQPSRYFSADAAYNISSYGNFWSGNLTFNPTSRTSLTASTTERGFGRSNALTFSEHTRKASYSLRYQEEFNTARGLLLSPVALYDAYVCNGSNVYVPVGTPPPDTSCVYGGQTGAASPIDTTATFVSKGLTGAFNYRLRRTTMTLSLFSNTRDYPQTGQSDRYRGMQATLSVKPMARTTFSLTGGESQVEAAGSTQQDRLWNVGLIANRKITHKVTGSMELSHQQRNSDTTANNYKENRLSAFLNMTL